jgi:hypothetical protein
MSSLTMQLLIFFSDLHVFWTHSEALDLAVCPIVLGLVVRSGIRTTDLTAGVYNRLG